MPGYISASLRFVDIKGYQKFSVPVPVRSAVWTETGTTASRQFQAAVRELSTYDYHRLLIAGGVTLGKSRRFQVLTIYSMGSSVH